MYLSIFEIIEGALRFIRQQRRSKVLSTTAVEPMTRGFVRSIEQFAQDNEIPIVNFEKGQRKDDMATKRRSEFRQSESSSAKLRRSALSIGPKSDTIQRATTAMPGL